MDLTLKCTKQLISTQIISVMGTDNQGRHVKCAHFEMPLPSMVILFVCNLTVVEVVQEPPSKEVVTELNDRGAIPLRQQVLYCVNCDYYS